MRGRKPLALAGAVAAVAVSAALITAQPSQAATTTGTYAQIGQACQSAYYFHHVDTTAALYADEALWQRAYHHAWHLAMFADPETRADIHHYLFTDRGWSAVRLDCVADDWAPQVTP